MQNTTEMSLDGIRNRQFLVYKLHSQLYHKTTAHH